MSSDCTNLDIELMTQNSLFAVLLLSEIMKSLFGSLGIFYYNH